MSRICIPDYEYKERVAKAAKMVADKGLDIMIVVSTESDYANARYFSGFWPLFERAGVAISANGDSALLVGPESAPKIADSGPTNNTALPLAPIKTPARSNKGQKPEKYLAFA